MKVRCKMICLQKIDSFDQWSTVPGQQSVRVKLGVANGPGNEAWSKYTPSGTLELGITNPEAFAAFKLGQAYFVDFTEAPFAAKDESVSEARP